VFCFGEEAVGERVERWRAELRRVELHSSAWRWEWGGTAGGVFGWSGRDYCHDHGAGFAAAEWGGAVTIWPLWPTLLSYVLSFLFVCIGWVNHYEMLRQVERVSPGLIWSNMAFLFTLSLIPFGTAYMAEQRMAAFTVAVYAFVFFASTVAFIPFEAMVARVRKESMDQDEYRRAMVRNVVALVIYGGAIALAFWWRWAAFAMIVGA